MIGGVRIIYSRIGDTADSVIKRIISSKKHGWIVVTSDRDIADYAWTCGSIPVSAQDFLKVFNKEVLLESEGDECEEIYREPLRKGNPRRLSKKEKAILRALKKL